MCRSTSSELQVGQNHVQMLHPEIINMSPCAAFNRRIHADVIVYIFADLHTALRIERNMLDMNWLQAAKELVKLSIWWNF